MYVAKPLADKTEPIPLDGVVVGSTHGRDSTARSLELVEIYGADAPGSIEEDLDGLTGLTHHCGHLSTRYW
jgi:hypothetical protein